MRRNSKFGKKKKNHRRSLVTRGRKNAHLLKSYDLKRSRKNILCIVRGEIGTAISWSLNREKKESFLTESAVRVKFLQVSVD